MALSRGDVSIINTYLEAQRVLLKRILDDGEEKPPRRKRRTKAQLQAEAAESLRGKS